MSAPAVLHEEKAEAPTPTTDSKRPLVTYTKLRGTDAEKLDSMFGIKDSLIEVNPGRVLLPPEIQGIAERIQRMRVRPDDVWVVSYPRTGSTWAQEMVWCIGNDLDFQGAKVLQNLRCPLLELTAIMIHDDGEWLRQLGNSVDLVENMASPRYIKTHLPWELLPIELKEKKPKIVYIARNPKDMCVSFYHYCRLVHHLKGSFEDFCELFLKGRAPVGPIWNHILGFWNRRHEPNILFLTYEEMKRDQEGAINKTAKFLEKTISDTDVKNLAEYLSFTNMRKNPAVNLQPIIDMKSGPNYMEKNKLYFIRKGEIGDWKNHMSPELAKRFDVWTEENLQGSGLTF